MSDAIIPFLDADSKIVIPDDQKQKYVELASLMAGSRPGFEEMGGAWRPAMVKLVQPVTTDPAKPENAKTGDLFHRGGPLKRPLRGVVVYAYYTRVRFVPGQDKKPSCSSENVDVMGRGLKDKSVSVYGDACAKCPYNDQPFTNGKKTNCNNVLNVIFVPENLENIFHLTFSKASFTVGKQLSDLARATAYPWSRFYEIGSEVQKRQGGSGIYAVPTVTPVAEVAVPEHLKAFAKYVCDTVNEKRQEEKKKVVRRQSDVAERANLDTLESEDVDSKGSFKDTM